MNILKNNKNGHGSIVHNDIIWIKTEMTNIRELASNTSGESWDLAQDAAVPKPAPGSCLASGKLCHTGHQKLKTMGATFQRNSSCEECQSR